VYGFFDEQVFFFLTGVSLATFKILTNFEDLELYVVVYTERVVQAFEWRWVGLQKQPTKKIL
jgi:hypothetical protein